MNTGTEVRLSSQEYLYLKHADFLNEQLMQLVHAAHNAGDGYVLSVSPQQAEEFGDALTERLAKAGFDAEYKPTQEGSLLEDLIDRFFIDSSDAHS